MNTRTLIVPLMLILSQSAIAQDKALSQMSTQQRLERLERMVSADVMLEQAQQMDSLREEITSLRSIVEQMQYELETVKQRQRSLYLDMDRRLMHLEAGAAVSTSPVPPPNTTIVPAVPVTATTPVQMTTASKDAKTDYDKAFELLKEGRYDQAIAAFSGFLASHAGSQYRDNAQYWLAEANYVSREYQTALNEFRTLIDKHPESTKIPGARLKIGYVYYELKDWAGARSELEQVVSAYPDTTVAKKARERLARMKREGR